MILYCFVLNQLELKSYFLFFLNMELHVYETKQLYEYPVHIDSAKKGIVPPP